MIVEMLRCILPLLSGIQQVSSVAIAAARRSRAKDEMIGGIIHPLFGRGTQGRDGMLCRR